MKIVLLIGLAGFLGTLVRFGCVRGIDACFPQFPWGTLVVNVVGAALAGFLFVALRKLLPQYEAYYPVLFIGFLGAFTMFSTFALESARFIADAQYGKFIGNVLLQNFTGIAAAYCGMLLAR